MPEQNDQVAYAALGAGIAAFGRPLRTLIVDDNPTNRLVAAKMLKDFDVQIDTACDGAEAVTAVNRFNYDMILMDVRMPEMDGLQATRIIRSRGGKQSGVPVIAFTANAFPEDIEACREAGMNDFVVKPARRKAMVEAILRVLPEPLAATEVLGEHRAPSLAPNGVAPVKAVSILDREVFRELVREIGEQAACEVHAVFAVETESRLKLLRGLSIEQQRTKIGGRRIRSRAAPERSAIAPSQGSRCGSSARRCGPPKASIARCWTRWIPPMHRPRRWSCRAEPAD